MKNTKILEMLNNNKIDELKALLQEEVYIDTLNSKVGSKQRYAAMKRYQSSIGKHDNNLYNHIGTDVNINGESYSCFIDGVSIALTIEETGELEKHDTNKHGEYFKIDKLIPDLYTSDGKINYNEILAEAKQQGYKYSKIPKNNKVVAKIGNEVINVALLEKAYSIIDDGSEPEIFLCEDTGKSPIILKNSIGICMVLPININSPDYRNELTIVEIAIKNKKAA